MLELEQHLRAARDAAADERRAHRHVRRAGIRVRAAVQQLRADGVSWEVIGEEIGQPADEARRLYEVGPIA